MKKHLKERERASALAWTLARANRKWSRPAGALGECEQASFRLRMALEQRGLESDVAIWDEPPHVAVWFDGMVLDMTMRQFDAKAPYPLVCSYDEWEERMMEVSA